TLDLNQMPTVVMANEYIGFREETAVGDDRAMEDRLRAVGNGAPGEVVRFLRIIRIDRDGAGESGAGKRLDGIAGELFAVSGGILWRNEVWLVNHRPRIAGAGEEV